MEPLDVVEDIGSCFGTRLVLPSIDALALEQAEEAFSGCIVDAASHAAHTASKLVSFQEPLVFIARKLTRFKGSSQRFRVGVNVGDYPAFRQVSSSQGSCEVGC